MANGDIASELVNETNDYVSYLASIQTAANALTVLGLMAAASDVQSAAIRRQLAADDAAIQAAVAALNAKATDLKQTADDIHTIIADVKIAAQVVGYLATILKLIAAL